MGAFCDRLKLGSTAALDCRAGQNKGRYRKKELLFLLVSLLATVNILIKVGAVHYKIIQKSIFAIR